MALKRDQLLAKRKELTEKVKKNKEQMKERKNGYKCARAYEGFGIIESLDEHILVLAYLDMKKKSDMSMYNAAAELGFKGFKEIHILGYTPAEWEHDFKNRAEYIRLERETKKLEQALDIIGRNLSDDDKFSPEMDALASLIGE